MKEVAMNQRSTSRREALGLLGLGAAGLAVTLGSSSAFATGYRVSYSDAEWKKRLTKAQYYILREEGTEPPGSSPLLKEHRKGTFLCAGCNNELYSSATKFESGTGWPSFWKPLPGAVGTTTDLKLGYPRTEVHCADCGGHLGHVFHDGPKPTGLRYCMDGDGMKFRPA
jgi:peptide-methionine (R)-S-oxide reductase